MGLLTSWGRRDSPNDARGLPGYPGRESNLSESKVQRELGFDPDSPDLGDPQIDPPWPARIPQRDGTVVKRAPGEQYPPYDE
ncbi:DUF6021 family protein [Pseudomonas sp. GD04019]|uniref:DUF6021 family protein n=2 Tax=unclassified Pseudomonas TaxID=196821 RepID=UPI0032674A3D